MSSVPYRLVLVLGLIAAPWDSAFAQDIKGYTNAIETVLDKWDSKDFVITRTPAMEAEFETRLKVFQARQESDELEKLIPTGFVVEKWKNLPVELKPEIPISQGARLMLTGGII